jgi:GntR family transcriptional regulator of gluconate operon
MRPLNRETLQDQAFESLRTAIRSGELRPGQRLVESEIAARMGVSRIPVREAIRSLEREGLVVSEPGRGASVVTLGDGDVEEIYGLRSALETYAVELIIEHNREPAIRRLQELVDAMAIPSRTRHRQQLMRIDLRFHQALCELSGNRRLLQAWLRLSDQIEVLLQLKDMVADDSGRLPSGHQRIVDAIAGGDVGAARDLLRSHIRMSAEQLLSKKVAP